MSEDSDVAIITTKALRKMYGPHLALDDVNLNINAGSIGILGPNGAGKSTFFKCLLGLIGTTSGEGSVLGYDIRTEADTIRSRIGYMPEYNSLDPALFAVDQVRYAGELLGMNSNTAMQRAHEVLEYVGLKDQRYRKIETFSTGMLQATKLACALVHDPDILICDEPTNGLDPAQIFQMRSLVGDLSRNATIIISTHILQEVEAICERVIIMVQGQIAVDALLSELQQSNRLMIGLGNPSEDAAEQLRKIPGVGLVSVVAGPRGESYGLELEGSVSAVAPQVARVAVEGGWGLYGMSEESRTLETVFREVGEKGRHAE